MGGQGGGGLTSKSQPLITSREIAEGSYSVHEHDLHFFCLHVCMSVFVCECEGIVPFFFVRVLTEAGEQGLLWAMEALFHPAFSYKARCVFDRGLGIPLQIFVLAAGRPLLQDTVRQCTD